MTMLPAKWATAEGAFAAPRWGGIALAWAELGPFALVALEFGLLVGVIGTYDLENQALGDVVQLAWFGFLVHHFLPLRFRLPFFALLSAIGVVVAMGMQPGLILLTFGAVLIALCHVPLPFGWRLTLLSITAGALLALRMEWLPTTIATALPASIWPILGSMFMFRLTVYLYDLRHSPGPFSLYHAAAYFFMLPNAALPLFPVVDYKTFCRSHFNDEPCRIYHVGVQWIFRGVLQLLLYQAVYLFLVVDPAEAVTAWDVLQYVVTTFLLYLRVSGTFHVIVGLLHLFGFNLPETHHLYYLSGSFTDFWRRINIYWKDFLTKVVFYPVYFRLKPLGDVRAMVLSTLVAFVATWLLHSYQWLWLRGSFPLTWRDAFFWLGLGMLVIVNMLRERARAPKRALAGKPLSRRAAVSLGLRTAGTFAVLSVLWTVWNTPSTSLRLLARAAANVTPGSIGGLIGVLLLVGVAGVLFGRRQREHTEGRQTRQDQSPLRFQRSAAGIALASMVILVVGRKPELLAFSLRLPGAIISIKRDKINRVDLVSRERGYYQDLGDAVRLDARTLARPPRGWSYNNDTKRTRNDFLLWEHPPSIDLPHKGISFTTNRWGMHDREYEVAAHKGTFRVAMVGSSHEVGAGVPLFGNYENLTEDRLNRERLTATVRQYEILNFAFDGDPPLQKIARLDQLAYQFRPDLVLYMAHDNELEWLPRRIDELLSRGIDVPYEDIARILAQAGVQKGMAFEELAQRLRPYRQDMMRWIFRHMQEQAQAHGGRAAVVMVERAEDSMRPAEVDELTALAHDAHVPVIDLWGAFAATQPRESLYLGPWDTHPNAVAHRLLADRLYRGLIEQNLLVPNW